MVRESIAYLDSDSCHSGNPRADSLSGATVLVMSRSLAQLKRDLTTREYSIVANGGHVKGVTVKEAGLIRRAERDTGYRNNPNNWAGLHRRG